MPDVGIVAALDESDPGDLVQRKFEYQSAFGVILLISAVTGKSDHVSIWCEQHEDFLAELKNGQFDAYQVKTKKHETGYWKTNDESFVKAMKRFVQLDTKYPNAIRNFHFVSDSEFLANRKTTPHLSPRLLAEATKIAASPKDLTGDAKVCFEALTKATKVVPESLLNMLKRLSLGVGPTERAFEDEIAQRYLPTIESCAHLDPKQLFRVQEGLRNLIRVSSSRGSLDAGLQLACMVSQNAPSAELSAKRISIERFYLELADLQSAKFFYLANLRSTKLGDGNQKLDVLGQKLEKGDLDTQSESLQRRTLSAEATLQDLATRDSLFDSILSELEGIVLSICDEEALLAKQSGPNYGERMMIGVYRRLNDLATSQPNRVHRMSADVLIGLVGLLAGDCKVWWSPKFTLVGKP